MLLYSKKMEKKEIIEKVLKELRPPIDKRDIGLLREAIQKALQFQEDKLRANIIRELKKNHPKGFCYICGKGKRVTIHHLRKNGKGKGKIVGEIPLCRECHDTVESMKRFVKLKQAYKEGYELAEEKFKKKIDKKINEWVEKQEKKSNTMDLIITDYKGIDELKNSIFGEENKK